LNSQGYEANFSQQHQGLYWKSESIKKNRLPTIFYPIMIKHKQTQRTIGSGAMLVTVGKSPVFF
jgi:hypothetical protein